MMMSQSFNRRHSPNRRKTDVDAIAEVDGEHLRVTILDVNYQGMKVAVPKPLKDGTAVRLFILSHKVPAIVHWYKDGKVGLNLLERLDSQTLRALESAADSLAAFR